VEVVPVLSLIPSTAVPHSLQSFLDLTGSEHLMRRINAPRRTSLQFGLDRVSYGIVLSFFAGTE